MSTQHTPFPPFVTKVKRVAQVSPSYVRITLGGDKLEHFAPHGNDHRIKLVLQHADGSYGDFGIKDSPPPSLNDWYSRWRSLADAERNPIRTYTPSAVRPDEREIDIDFVLHEPAGPATAWAASARPGDELIVVGPDVRAEDSTGGMDFQPRGARRLLLAADESGLPAVRNILQNLPETSAASVFLEVPTAADCVPMPAGNTDVVVTWLVRGEHPYGERLTQAIDAWAVAAEISGSFYAWVAGESTTVKTIRRHLVRQCDLPPSSVTFSGYWKLGSAES